ncbi:glycosyltransferase family 1 protein [Calycina marina]|uniref:Glycosyltransferase family 1 protein n=1 Tax=Calycina marina TaxID=1763456 RepID=A0A9P8CD89_9HELO|nr:glycosyltransferase family 1 protein [Calycina marina]
MKLMVRCRYASNMGIPNILTTGTDAPPAYGDHHDQLELNQDGFSTSAKVTDDGRLNIKINQKTRKLSDLLVPALRNQLKLVAQEEETPLPPGYIPPALGGLPGQALPPRLNVVIHVVGSRGDVQPFIALGKVLKATYGHRVRLATHPTFKTFVEEHGLEFFSIGGDPSELMAFMVKNPNLMPGFDSLKSGDVGKRRKGMEEIVLACWRSCIEAGDGLDAPPKKDDEGPIAYDAGINLDADPTKRPFIADAIIANPPSFAHIHIAEKMGIPLHMMFTMPWSPTQQFPHPLANIQSSNADVNMTNFVSYALVEMMTWQGLGDVINRFRERALGLDPISLIWAPGMLSRLRIPYTYCWSPALIPKPKDWGQHISISGFYFLSLASSFTPEPDLAAYLAAGPPPVYIGFGSIVVDDPDAMTKMIFEAVKKAGVRALVSKGWGGLGADALGIPEGVFMLGNVPHDWLFQHVSCVVHHGGAGTTAAGISTGKSTVIIPFFGDQPFWGAMVAKAGAGPVPVPYTQLTSDKLAASITEALKPETLKRAQELGAKIKEENGSEMGGKSFHDQLNVDSLRCAVAPSRVAVWRLKRTNTRLSALAATVLAGEGLLDFADLKLYRAKEYETEDGPWDPISGGASALLGTIASLTMGVADFPIEIFRAVKKNQATKQKEHSSSTSGTATPTSIHSPTLTSPRSGMISEPVTYSPGAESSNISTKATYEGTLHSFGDAHSPPPTPPTATAPHTGSMKEALMDTSPKHGSRSNSRDRSHGHQRSDSTDRRPGLRSASRLNTKTEFDPSKLTLDNAIGACKGIQRIVAAGMKSPMDFTLGIARGFHNAPKLYGDTTVRPQEKVTDFQSGLKAAGKEFGYGMYDGISGLITQPMHGVEKEGVAGLFKGIAKGIGGVVLKPGAAMWGLPGYTFMGVHKEIRKLFGYSVLNYIISVRTACGYEDFRTSTLEERHEIIARWKTHKKELQNPRQNLTDAGGPDVTATGHLTPKGFMQTRHLPFDERRKLHAERKKKRDTERHKVQSADGHRSCPFCRRDRPHSHKPKAVQEASDSHDVQLNTNDEFEEAIRASVAATSRGDPAEDLVIERAIRASVRELQKGPGVDGQEAVNRAIAASISEANRRREQAGGGLQMTAEEAEHERALEKSIQESLANYHLTDPTGYAPVPTYEENDYDEDLRLAIEMSKKQSVVSVDPIDSDDSVVKRAIEESKRLRTEEEIVLDYVKKQTLLEEQHRKAVAAQGKSREESDVEDRDSDADAEALRRAIEESMRGSDAGPSGTS